MKWPKYKKGDSERQMNLAKHYRTGAAPERQPVEVFQNEIGVLKVEQQPDVKDYAEGQYTFGRQIRTGRLAVP